MSTEHQNNKKIVIIIPAFNEEKKIGEVIKSLPSSFNGIGERRIVVVDDGSADRTAELAQQEEGVTVIRHLKNKGVGAAVRTGLDYALSQGADLAVNIDADGQFEPKEINSLIDPILTGRADCVIASRFINKDFIPINMPKAKIWGNKAMALIISGLTKNSFYDVSCGFRAYGREAILRINLFGNFTYTQESLIDLYFKGMRIVEVPSVVKYFQDRKSRVAGNLVAYAIKSLRIIIQTIVNYKPMAFFGSAGLVSILVGTVMDIALFIYFLIFSRFTPYKFWGVFGGFLVLLGILLVAIALLANMIKRVQMNQESILYYEKKKNYY